MEKITELKSKISLLEVQLAVAQAKCEEVMAKQPKKMSSAAKGLRTKATNTVNRAQGALDSARKELDELLKEDQASAGMKRSGPRGGDRLAKKGRADTDADDSDLTSLDSMEDMNINPGADVDDDKTGDKTGGERAEEAEDKGQQVGQNVEGGNLRVGSAQSTIAAAEGNSRHVLTGVPITSEGGDKEVQVGQSIVLVGKALVVGGGEDEGVPVGQNTEVGGGGEDEGVPVGQNTEVGGGGEDEGVPVGQNTEAGNLSVSAVQSVIATTQPPSEDVEVKQSTEAEGGNHLAGQKDSLAIERLLSTKGLIQMETISEVPQGKGGKDSPMEISSDNSSEEGVSEVKGKGKAPVSEPKKSVKVKHKAQRSKSKKSAKSSSEEDDGDDEEDMAAKGKGKGSARAPKAGSKGDTVAYEDWDDDKREKIVAKARAAFRAFLDNGDEVPAGIKRKIRENQELLPEAATISRALALHILTSTHGNIQCLYHGKAKVEGKLGGYIDGFLISGTPGRRRVKSKKNPNPGNPESGHIHCGCEEEKALLDFILWKTLQVSYKPVGNKKMPREGMGSQLFEPRGRMFVIEALQKYAAWSLDFLYTGQGDADASEDAEFPDFCGPEHQRKVLLASMEGLFGRVQMLNVLTGNLMLGVAQPLAQQEGTSGQGEQGNGQLAIDPGLIDASS